MSKFKTAIVIENAFSYAGTENICNYMTECFSLNSTIDLFSIKGGDKPFYPYRNVRKIFTFENHKYPINKVISKINKEEYTHVFIISMGKLSFLFMLHLFFKKNKSKTIYISCEHVAIKSFNFFVRSLKYFSLRKYNKVIVLTDVDKLNLKRKNINAIKIPNPISFNFFERKVINKKILAVGRLTHQKGFDKLLKIWKVFVEKNPSWILNIAGDGELKEELLETVKNLNLSCSVNFLGKVTNIDELYMKSDIFLMTSRYEGLPLVLLEAKSWSLPVISYDCPTGPREIITNEVDGLLIPNDDANQFLEKLDMLANDEGMLLQLSKNSFETYKKFSTEIVAEKWRNVLNEKE